MKVFILRTYLFNTDIAYTAPRFGVVNLCSVSEGSES